MDAPSTRVSLSTLEIPRATAMAVVFSLALFTGAYGLMEQSPWIDELHTLATARKGLLPGILTHMSGNIPPGTAVLEWIWSLGGRSLLGARMLSVLAFSASSAVFFRGASRVLPPRGALLASVLFATNPALVWHAQDARPYAVLVLFATLSFVTLLRTLEGEAGQARFLFVWALLGFSIHIYFGCFVAAMFLHALPHRNEKAGRSALVALMAAGTLAVGMVALMSVMSTGTPAGFQKPVNSLSIVYSLLVFAVGYSFGATNAELHAARALDAMRPYLPAAAAILVAFWAVVALGALLSLRERPSRFREWMGYLVLPILMPFVVALAAKAITFNVRYVLSGLVGACLFVGAAASRSPRAAAVVLLPLGVQLWGLFSYHSDRRHWKEDFWSLATYLESHSSPADHVYECPFSDLVSVVVPDRSVRPLVPESLADPVAATGAHAIYVFNRPWVCDPDERMRHALESEQGVTATTEIRGFEVYVR